MAEHKKITNFTIPILVVLLVGVAFFAGTIWAKVKSLQQESKRVEEQERLAEATPTLQPTPEELESTIGGFSLTKDTVCQEDDKPMVYFFGGSFCPHCRWEHPIMEKVAKNFKDQISFHNNMDKQDVDKEVWDKYSQINQGAVPFLVLGCRYVRVGSGENYGEKDEEKFLTALICKLTDNQPEKICTPVKDLIDQVK